MSAEAEKVTKKAEYRYPSFDRIKHVNLIACPIPLRCVNVFIDEDGDFEEIEIPVIGIEIIVKDTYVHPKIPVNSNDPEKGDMSPKSLFERGWRVRDADQDVDYNVVIWSYEFDRPITLGSVLQPTDGKNFRSIVGPKEDLDFWLDAIKGAKKYLEIRGSSARGG